MGTLVKLLCVWQWVTVWAIIDSTSISMNENITYYSYMWFGFEDGGTVQQNTSVTAPKNSTVGFYLCTSSQRNKIESVFGTLDYCSVFANDAGDYAGCDFKYAITQHATNVSDTTSSPQANAQLPFCSVATCPTRRCNMTSCHTLNCDPSICTSSICDTPDCPLCAIDLCPTWVCDSTNPNNCTKTYNNTHPDVVNTVNIAVKINHTDYYWFVVTNCNRVPVQINMNYVLMNPGGEHLSVGYIEFKYLMNAFEIVWSVFLGLWLLSWAISRKREVAVVQILLIVDTALWTVYSYVEDDFWYSYSEEGIPNQDLSLISYIHYSLAESLFFALLELATGGLGISRKCFKPSLKRNAPLIGAVLLVLLWMYKLFGSVVLFILAGIYLLLLKHYCSNISRNCRKMTKQIQLIAQVGIDPVSTPVWLRLRMFHILRISLLLLLPLLSGGLVAGVFYLELMPWVQACTHIGILVNSYVIMLLYFHFKHRDPYFDKVVRLQLSEEGPLVSLEDITRGMVTRDNLSPWSFGMPLPYPQNRVVSIVAPLVVVDQMSSLETGTLQIGVPLEVVITEVPEEENSLSARAKVYELNDSIVSAGDVELELSSGGNEILDLRDLRV